MSVDDAPNEAGELSGAGPPYACERYATRGHDMMICPGCKARFRAYMSQGRREQCRS